MITIDTAGSGALLHGSDRADNDLLRPIGWRWSRRLNCLYLARTLRPETVDWKVEQTVKALAPRAVTVTGQDDRLTNDEREERRAERDVELIDVHEHRAVRAAGEADAHYSRFRQIGDSIPMGQPILVGHHSEGRHRRDLAKMDRLLGKSVEAHHEAQAEEGKARSARHRVATHLARDAAPAFSKDTVNVGDIIHTPWKDSLVLRVSAKSVTVPSFIIGLPYTDTLPYPKVRGIAHPASDESLAAVKDALAKVKAHRAEHKGR